MAVNDLGIVVPAGSDAVVPDADMRAMGASFAGRIIVPVANTTARDALATALSPSASSPLYVHRADADAAVEAWTAFTPNWQASSNPSIGNGTLEGAYRQIGKTVQFRIKVVAGTTTNRGSGTYRFDLPVTPEVDQRWVFTGALRDAGSATYPLFAERDQAGSVQLRTSPTTAGSSLRSVDGTTPFTFGNLDEIAFSGEYEVQ